MRYIPSTEEQQREMLKEIGVSSFEELIASIPEKVRLKRKLNLPPALSEHELEEKIVHIAQKNADFYNIKPLIGAGAYRHFIPEAAKALMQREEFWTCYTPYQPELSQGTLQAIFEFQSHISRLTKMEVVIPSIFDGASATAEAALMSIRLTHKEKIIISSLLHPHYRETVKTYLEPHNIKIVELPFQNCLTSVDMLKQALDNNTAAVIIQSPNFLGGIEDIEEVTKITHQDGALLIQVIIEAMSLGLLKAPGNMNVDIVAGSTQSYGLDLHLGGPYNAFLATKKSYIRQLPGRIVGETKDKNGKRAFVMTLRAREQDIRREKATSNICTNHNLNVMAGNIYLSLLGTEGLYQYSLLNFRKAHYLEKELLKSGKFSNTFTYPYFNEFLISYQGDIKELQEKLVDNNFIPPLSIVQFYSEEELKQCLLFAVTEIFSREELNYISNLLSR
ncbi:MAG TPA: aminomethyl-transferring glycine dehydrogenase subunit GcvPA [Atribacterota bacterium]|nr:aminomethyl-transferring glycine dehydrogenase subunit GcvPA [Atribacterota bacterium]